MASTPAPPLAPVRRVNLWQTFIALALLVLAAAWLFTGGLPILGGLSPVVRWGVLIVLMLFLLLLIGYSTNGQVLGALIDSTNHMSLSKLQITAWTVLVLSAYLIIAVPRLLASVIHPNMQPLQITFPPELILAMGISAASFSGSSLIQQNKKKKQVNLQTRTASLDDAKRSCKTRKGSCKTRIQTPREKMRISANGWTPSRGCQRTMRPKQRKARRRRTSGVLNYFPKMPQRKS